MRPSTKLAPKTTKFGRQRRTAEAKCAELPILDIKLAMYAATSILQLGNYKKETDNWEGRNAAMKTWSKWKQAYLAAYTRGVSCQHAGATDKLFSQAANLVMLPAAHDVIYALAGLLDNLALVATTNRTTVHQLMLANLLLMTSVATLTTVNKKFTKMMTCYSPAPQGRGGGGGRGVTMPAMAPKQFRATTAGCMGTRYCIPANSAM
jgi:hypothetical protein